MVQQCSELEEIAEYKVLLREAGLDDNTEQMSEAGDWPASNGSTAMLNSPGKRSMPIPNSPRTVQVVSSLFLL
jgi:hypothetical protein